MSERNECEIAGSQVREKNDRKGKRFFFPHHLPHFYQLSGSAHVPLQSVHPPFHLSVHSICPIALASIWFLSVRFIPSSHPVSPSSCSVHLSISTVHLPSGFLNLPVSPFSLPKKTLRFSINLDPQVYKLRCYVWRSPKTIKFSS